MYNDHVKQTLFHIRLQVFVRYKSISFRLVTNILTATFFINSWKEILRIENTPLCAASAYINFDTPKCNTKKRISRNKTSSSNHKKGKLPQAIMKLPNDYRLYIAFVIVTTNVFCGHVWHRSIYPTYLYVRQLLESCPAKDCKEHFWILWNFWKYFSDRKILGMDFPRLWTIHLHFGVRTSTLSMSLKTLDSAMHL